MFTQLAAWGNRQGLQKLISCAKILFCLCSFVVFLFFGSSTAVARAKISSPDQIRSITITGNNHIRRKDILRVVKSNVGQTYLQSAVEEDLRQIYQLGYFADVKLDVVKKPDGVAITFVVKENPIVTDIVFVGNKTFRAKRLKSEIGFRKSAVLTSDTLDDYAEKIKRFYDSKEIEAEVTGTIEPVTADSCRLRYTITEHKRQKIIRLEILGNEHIKTHRLLKKLKSRKSWWIVRRYYNPEDIASDCVTIERLYKDEGFLRVKVTALDPEPVHGQDGVRVCFKVEEGTVYSWRNITIAGNTLFSTNELQRYVQSSSGARYSQTILERDIVRIYEHYANLGYIQTEVKPQLELDDNNHTVNVTYSIFERPRCYVGEINILGFKLEESRTMEEVPLKTKQKVILREVTLQRGDVMSRNEILKSQQRLYNLGFFDRVSIIPEPTVAEDTMDLSIAVIEKKTGNIMLGGGYSSEKKAALYLDISELNLLGTGRQVRVHTEIAEEGTDYSLTFRDPYFLDTPWTAEFAIFRESLERSLTSTPFEYDSTGNQVYSESSSHDYQEKKTGATLFVSYPINQNLRLTTQLKHVKFSLTPEEEGYIIPSIVGPTESITHSITPGIIYDTRDNYLWPTRGSRYVANIEIAGGPFGGDNNYIKYYGESCWYKRLGHQVVGALRVRGGYIAPYDDTDDAPLPDRFYLGGANSLRGYDFRGVSPRVTYIDEDQQEVLEVNVGGDVMLNANVELRRPLVDRIYGIVFLDAGGVWRKIDDVNFDEVRYGVGAGILFNLFFGTIQLGYGIPINTQSGDETQGFYFTFGSTF
ncbi:MAG: outer membrane protein assembly factor BamA [bacterium]|nr:outer membrane protein assembly factor BamA [bacterium]